MIWSKPWDKSSSLRQFGGRGGEQILFERTGREGRKLPIPLPNVDFFLIGVFVCLCERMCMCLYVCVCVFSSLGRCVCLVVCV